MLCVLRDMAELLKTPGRLRGKTPGTARKRAPPPIRGHEVSFLNSSGMLEAWLTRLLQPVTTIFDIKHPAAAVDSADNPFYNAIAQLPTNKKLSLARKPSKSPTRSIKVLQDAQPSQLPDTKDTAVHLDQVEEGSQPGTRIDGQISAGDSGIWSVSSTCDLQQTQEPGAISQRMSILPENFNFAPSGPDRDSVYRTLPEDSSDPPQRLPVQRENTVQSSSPAPPSPKPSNLELLTDKSEEPEKLETIEQLKVKPNSFADEPKPSEKLETIKKSAASPKEAAPEPRRSGRLAERLSSPLPTSPQLLFERANDVVPPSSPPVLPRQEVPAADEEDVPTLPTARCPSPLPVLTGSVRPITPTGSARSTAELSKKSPTRTPQGSPSKLSSEPSSPDAPIIRKSILNFAALPAREPLTSKKSLGMKTTRDSHVEQVRLNGAGRASWMNKKGNGKSLSASSRQIERQDEDLGEEERAKVPLNRKRKSESVRDDSQKKSKGSTDGLNQNKSGIEDMEEASSGETSEAMALHNKAYTQRLQDKIQRLGKPREARSFPPSVPQGAGTGYPELPQDGKEVHSLPKRTKSDPQGQLPHTVNPARWASQPGDEEEWIPMKQESKRQLNRSNTEETTEPKQKEIEAVRPQSAHKWNNTLKQTIDPASIAIPSTTTSESAPIYSLKSPTYPPKRHLPGSPLKSSFSDDWIKAPASPTRPPGEGAISAVKAHTTSVFKKAKQMLLNSSVSSASAKIETMTPGLRSWHGGNNLRQQMISDSGPSHLHDPLKQQDQLYPDLGSVLDTKVQASAPKNSASSKPTERPVAVEHVTEPTREGRTRSSRSRDTGDATPGLEESAPKVQKKSKADERAEREASRVALREREEKLREAEEELRIAKEEQQKDREEELRQAKEQQRRQEERARREREEQVRKEKEEQVRKEKEESRRRQEERLRQEKDELRRRQQEELRRQEEAQKISETPSNFQDDEDFDISDRDEESATESTRGRITSSAEPERPPSRLQKGGPRFQRTGDGGRPLRPGTADKNLPKPKPVSISVGTASQREMQSQRSKPNILTSSTLVAALKQSFEPPGLQASSSQISLSSSVSANSLRVSNPTGSKQLKSLAAAASQLKKVFIISHPR